MPVDRRTRALAIATGLALLIAVFSVDYTVKPGDTLGEIAREHDIGLSKIVAANDISNPDLIHPGQVLFIPAKDKIHMVAKGESLYRIAAQYSTGAGALAKANKLPDPDLIFPGQKLVIPGGGGSGGASRASGNSDGESEGSNEEPSGKYSRSGRFHVVERGQTLDSIANLYKGVSADDIAAANGVTNGRVYTGTRLFLDGPAFTARGSGGSGSYTVQQGDRLGDIAARFDTTISKIASNNEISNVNLIRSGQKLAVPGGGGNWVCPVANASFLNDWGFPRAGGTRFHEGNDLFTEYGAEIRAPVSGTVRFKTGPLGGLQFNLIGSDGVEYIGSHLDSQGKSGKVNAGDVIGYVGSSGNAQGTHPHLHFGMYIGGLVINPYPSLIAHDCK